MKVCLCSIYKGIQIFLFCILTVLETGIIVYEGERYVISYSIMNIMVQQIQNNKFILRQAASTELPKEL